MELTLQISTLHLPDNRTNRERAIDAILTALDGEFMVKDMNGKKHYAKFIVVDESGPYIHTNTEACNEDDLAP